MKDMPMATVIIPIYNVEAYLAECVDSILAQTFTDLQIILVDDGSPDGCSAICDAYAAKDARIEVIHKPNGGLGSARNAGLEIARGKYVYFVDSDDTIEPDTIEKTVAEMETHGWDLCAWGLVAYWENDDHLYYMGRTDRAVFFFDNEQEKSRMICRYYLRGRVRWEVCSRVFRRELIEQQHIRFGNERKIFAEDLDFSYRYLLHCRSMVCLPEFFYRYRLRGTSIMHTKKWEHQCQQLSNLLVSQRDQVGELVPYGKRYLCEAVIIAVFLGGWHEDYDPIVQTQQLRHVLQSTENWPYLLEEMKLAKADRKGLCQSCGLAYGLFLHALCSYLADGGQAVYTRRAKLYFACRSAYEKLRDVKNTIARSLTQLRGKKQPLRKASSPSGEGRGSKA